MLHVLRALHALERAHCPIPLNAPLLEQVPAAHAAVETCVICFADDVPTNKGTTCFHGHFQCATCFEETVQHQASADYRGAFDHHGAVVVCAACKGQWAFDDDAIRPFASFSFFELSYFVIAVSDFNDRERAIFLQTASWSSICFHRSCHALGCSRMHASNALEEPQDHVAANVEGVSGCQARGGRCTGRGRKTSRRGRRCQAPGPGGRTSAPGDVSTTTGLPTATSSGGNGSDGSSSGSGSSGSGGRSSVSESTSAPYGHMALRCRLALLAKGPQLAMLRRHGSQSQQAMWALEINESPVWFDHLFFLRLSSILRELLLIRGMFELGCFLKFRLSRSIIDCLLLLPSCLNQTFLFVF
jgi:hypothetical protein